MLHRRALLADMEATDPTLENDGPDVSDANSLTNSESEFRLYLDGKECSAHATMRPSH